METKEELKKRLTPLQYQVTQEAGTERAFTGEPRHISWSVFNNLWPISFQANTISTMMRACISASFAIRIYLAQKLNSMLVVDGLHLMTSWTREKLRYTRMQVLQVNFGNKCIAILCARVLLTLIFDTI